MVAEWPSSEYIVVVLSHLKLVRYIAVVSLTAIVWDFCLTAVDEVRLVWRAPSCWVKYLFLVNRYLGPMILVFNLWAVWCREATEELCHYWFQVEGWGGLVAISVVQIILVLRVSALYERSTVITRLLVLLLVGHIASTSTILALGIRQISPIVWLDSIFLGCVTFSLPSFFWLLWIPHLIFETIVFTLTAIKIGRALKGDWAAGRLLRCVLRDGTIYFANMFVMTFVTTMIWVFAPPSLIKLAISPTLAISNISGCRIILNLRALNQKDPDDFHLQSIGVTECRDGLGGQEELQPVARTMSFGGRIPCINSSMENGMIEPEVSRHVHLTHPHSTTESHEDARGGRE